MNMFRLHIRPHGGEADMRTTFDFCLRRGVLGVGWRVRSNKSTNDWREYYEQAILEHPGGVSTCSAIHREVTEGDLVWTRGPDGQYYLARVTSPWEYLADEEATERDIDIANVVRCDIRTVPTDAVPGKVVACFRPARTFQAIRDPRATEYTKHLWNKLAGAQVYEVEASSSSDIFMMLDDQETEDLLLLYLQSQGWFVVPNSRKSDTMSFEYMLVKPDTNAKAWAQVKTGNRLLNRDHYRHYPHHVILFQPNGLYDGDEATNVTCISSDDVLRFFHDAKAWLPDVLVTKADLLDWGEGPRPKG